MSYIYNRQDQKDIRRKLRKNQTLLEQLLWSKLRNRQLLGYKFRRQYGIGSYIVDFCCTESKLIIEVDGDSHFKDQKSINDDKTRQLFIESFGFKFLRFTNKEVTENIEGALEVVANNLKNDLT